MHQNPSLTRLHGVFLDKAVDKAYRKEPFTSERQRIEYLFELYQKLTAPLILPERKRKPRSTK